MTVQFDVKRLVKSALEEGVEIDERRVRAIERLAGRASAVRRGKSFLRQVAPWLAAAVVAATLSFTVFVLAPRDGESDDCLAVVGAISLLCEVDGIADDVWMGASASESLLAWQDLPCADEPQVIY